MSDDVVTAVDTSPPPAAPPAAAKKGGSREVRGLFYGARRELPGGGWFRIVPRVGNVELIRRRERLQDAKRTELGKAIDDPLPLSDALDLSLRCMLGPVITGWGDFVLDGEPVDSPPSRHRPGDTFTPEIEAVGMQLLGMPDILQELEVELAALDSLYARKVEVAEGNSEVRSDTT
jgi:hypothetical protein